MKSPRRLLQDPVAIKRWRRFRNKRRAWWSLWILLALYLVSLLAELIANDRPLYVRFEGRSYFPAFRYHAESEFVEGGRGTRPDYRRLNESPDFRDETDNFMVFTPFPYGPYESVDPASLRDENRVTIAFTPIPFVGNVNVTPDFTVARAAACGFFFGTNDSAVAGLDFTRYWEVPDVLRRAVETRFANRAADEVEVRLLSRQDPGIEADISLSCFRERSRAPATVRITFRQPPVGSREKQSFAIAKDGTFRGEPPAVWEQLDATTRQDLLAMAGRAFDEIVYPEPVRAGTQRYRVEIQRNDISWPYPPTHGHWLGIDSAGRDVFARILYGLRISMTFGFLLVLVSFAIGIVVGAIQGYFGGAMDITGQRLIEIWSALPFLYVMILMGSVFGRHFMVLLVCYGLFRWIGISYYIRAEFLRLRKFQFVEAAKCLGIPAPKIIFRHVLPNALTPIVTLFPFSLVGAIGALAALDYLGFGLPPPTASWGEMLHQAQQFRWAWWLILYPSLALFVVMLLGVFVGEGVRDAYDPRRFSKME